MNNSILQENNFCRFDFELLKEKSKNQMNPRIYGSLKYILLAALLVMPIFGFLDTLPIRMWDEARIACNALQMFHDGDYVVTHLNFCPEMWNTKPPLLIWLQVFFMHTIGTNEIAIRLPSALAAFGICLAILIFSLRYLKNFWFAFIAILTLITAEGFVTEHVSRTGDYDALLTLFTTVSSLFFYAYCETKKTKFLYSFFMCLLLAAYTKGVAGMLFTPALFLFALFQKEVLPLLKNKHFYIGLFSFLVLILSYYFLRETQNPGYLQAVSENELGGRFLSAQGEHQSDFFFYLDRIRTLHFPDKYLLVPCGLILGMAARDKRIQRFSLFLTLLIFTFFIIISTAKTKLGWYDAPLYPLFSMSVALLVYFIFDFIQNSEFIKQKLSKNVLPYLLLFLLFIIPYKNVWNKTYYPLENSWDAEPYEVGYFLKNALKGKYDLNNTFLVAEGYNAQNAFYLDILNDKGVKTYYKNYKKLEKGDVVYAYQGNIRQYITQNYECKEKRAQSTVMMYTIYGAKKDSISKTSP